MKKYIILIITLVIISCSNESVEIPKDEFADCRTELSKIPQEHMLTNMDSLGIFEGDILFNNNKSIIGKTELWKDGIIPFYFKDEVPDFVREATREAARIITKETYLEVIEYPNVYRIWEAYGQGADHLYFRYFPFATASFLGKQGGAQKMLVSGVDDPYIMIHEFLHAADTWHETNWSNRDQWLNINYENMEEYYHNQYAKYPITSEERTFGEKPDTTSIMMFSSFLTSKEPLDGEEKKPSITWKDGSTWGDNKSLSEMDIKGINTVYRCEYYNRTHNQ